MNQRETVRPSSGEKAPSAFKKAWNWISTGLTIGLIVMAIYCVIGVSVQNKTGKLFFPLGFRAVKILSGSMEDTLQTGALVIVKQTKEVEEGDIIFFYN